jgi:type IV pilus assembly protein PilN
MTHINLLPWREARRQQQQIRFLTMLAAGGVAGILCLGFTHLLIENQIAQQETRNQYLRGEITRLKKAEAEIKELDKTKARLLGRLEVIQNLQSSRPGMVKVFDALVRLLPENAYLTLLKNEGNQLTLKGIASSNNVISLFMRKLTDSPEFGEPTLRLVETQNVNDTRASEFELVVSLKNSAQDAQEEVGTL